MPILLPPLPSIFLAWRNLRLHKGRTLLTMLGITLGVAVVLAIQVTNQSTLDSIRHLFERAAGQASLVVTSTNPGVERLEAGIVAQLERAPGVQVAAPSVHVQTLLASEAQSWQIAFTMTGIAEGNMLSLYGVEADLDPQVRYYKFSAGRMLRPGEYEVVLPQKYAEDKGLHLGDDLNLLIPQGTARLKIVGLLAQEGVALLNGGAVAFAPLDVVQDLFGIGEELDEVALRLPPSISESPQRLEEIKHNLSQRLQGEAEVIYPGARGRLVSQMIATYQLGLSFFSMIAVFVGAFLVYNTFSMSVVERSRQIGMLRAIGVRRWGVMRIVLAEALLLAGVGSALGLGLGMILARGLMSLMGQAALTIESLGHVPWQGLLQGLGVGVGVTLGSALLPAFQAARISPLEALRVRVRSVERVRPIVWISGLALLFVSWMVLYRIPWREAVLFPVGSTAIILVLFGATLTVTLASNGLERVSRLLALAMYGNEGALGSANVRRAVSRTTLTVASLMIALTMIISIHSMAFSFKQDMNSWIINALGGDLYVRSPVPMRSSFARQLLALPGVQVVTPVRILLVRIAPRSLPVDLSASESLHFTAIEPRTYRQIADMEFVSVQTDVATSWARLEKGDALFISSVIAERYHLNVGDHLYLLTRRGEHAFEVAAVVIDFTGQGQVVYGTYTDLQRWFGEGGVDRFTVKVTPGYSVEATAQAIKERYQPQRHISIQTTEAFRQSIMDLLDQVFRLFDVLSLIGMIIGALGVINTLAMNVMERQREIGGLRSLGMTRRQVSRMVLAEALALGVMGGIYGLASGRFVGQVMVMGMNMMVGYNLTYRFSPQPFIVGAFIALVVVQLAAYLPARRAAKVNVVEAIKHE